MTALDGRTVLITGAGERAGAHLALGFAEAGATVYANHLGLGVRADATAQIARERGHRGSIVPIEADITDVQANRSMVDSIADASGGIDVLVHNASSFRPRPFMDLDETDVDGSFGVNLRGPLFLSQAVAGVMRRQGSGRILAILGNSLTESWPDLVPHVVSKSALGRLMQQLAVALSPVIQCNSVAPSQFFRSDDGVNDALRAARGEPPVTAETTVVGGVSIRETTLADVLTVLLFLAVAPPSLNGVTIPVDGGRLLV